MTYDIMIIIKIFYRGRCSCGENFESIRPTVAENFFFHNDWISVVLVKLWRHNEDTDDIIINIFYSPWGVVENEPGLNFFPWSGFRDMEVHSFSKIAPVPHDLWHHDYHWNILQEEMLLWWKFRVNQTKNCREIKFILIESSVVLVKLWCHN